jgi:5'/3'-nucleotidase
MSERVLITNDDGIAAPGIRALAEATAANGYDVVVAAPTSEASGTSAAMSAYTTDGKVILERRELDGLPEIAAFGVGASPGYIVVLAMLAAFGEPPDYVLSGINRGANAGRAVLHSGTVGAALTAAAHDRPAMAVSLDVLSPLTATSGGNAIAVLDEADDEQRNWSTAARYAGDLLASLPDLPWGTALNLNVPDLPFEQVHELRRARLARFGQVQMAVAETGEDFIRTAVEESRAEAEPGTDLALLTAGYATLTAIQALTEVPDLRLQRTDHSASA